MAAAKSSKGAGRSPRNQAVFPVEPKTWHCVSLLTLLTLIFFREILLGNAFLWEDFLYAWYPYRQFAVASVAQGSFPLWNPYNFGGMPFFADIQMQMFYLPISTLAFAVHNGHLGVIWLELVNILHYPIAGIGMFFLANSFRLNRWPSFFAGLTFMLSGFMVTHAIHQVIITLVAWYPWILLLFRKSLTETRWIWTFATALLLGHTFFAGFPQLSLFFYFFLFAFFVFELLTTFPGHALHSRPALMMTFRAATIVVLSLGVTLVQMLPTLEMTRLAVRAEISFEKATEGSFAWLQLLTFLFPKFFGTASAFGYNYWGPGTYWYYWETCVYIGILPFLLSILSLRFVRSSKYISFFFGFGVFSILFALGGNFVLQKFFFYCVPGFSTFRNPSRMTVFVAFGASLLSGFSLQALFFSQARPILTRPLVRIVVAVSGAGALFWLGAETRVLDSVFPFFSQQQIFSSVVTSTRISMLFLLLSAGLLYAAFRRPSLILLICFPGLLFVDLHVFGESQNNGDMNPEIYFSRAQPIVRFLKRDNEVFRVNTRNADGLIMDRNQGMYDRIPTMEGYTPLVLQRILPPVDENLAFDLMNVRYRTVTDRQARSLRLVANPTVLPHLFFAYGIVVAHSDEEVVHAMKEPGFRHGAVAVLEQDPGGTFTPTADSSSSTAHIVRYGINSFDADVETPTRGVLVISEMYYPGWKAFIDGHETEVYRADYNLRAIVVEAGRHAVSMKFEPESFFRGAIGSACTIIFCLLGITISFLRSRKHTSEITGQS